MMAIYQNQNEKDEESVEDGLAALKKLAALDNADVGTLPPGSSSEIVPLADTIPDWLELLLAKYGEEASMLIGVEPKFAQPGAMPEPPPAGGEPSKVTSLLEQMAAESETGPPPDRLATSVDWGKPPTGEEVGEEAGDWLGRITELAAPPITPVEEEAPDWLDKLGQPEPEAEAPAQQPGPFEGKDSEPPADAEGVPDWLQELAPPPKTSPPEDLAGAPKPAGPSPPSAPEAEVPDWLSKLEPTTPGAEPPAGALQREDVEGDVPDWLARLEDTPAPEAEGKEPPLEVGDTRPIEETEPPDVVERLREDGEAVEGPLPVAREAPEWLRELEADDAISPEPAPPEVPPAPLPLEPTAEAAVEAEAEVPDWLASLRADEGAEQPGDIGPPPPEAAGVPSTTPEAEQPDWLAALRAADESDAMEPGAEYPVSGEIIEPREEELPDWLAELRATQVAAEALPVETEAGEEIPPGPPWDEGAEPGITVPPAGRAADEVETEAPEWLTELPTEKAPTVEEVEALPTVEYPASAEIEEAGALDWLAEIEAIEAAEEYPKGEEYPPGPVGEAEAKAPPLETEAPPSAAEEGVPEWLAAELPAGEEAPPATEELTPAEIPDWLKEPKLEEGEPAERPQVEYLPSEESVETEGVLAGLPGLLPDTEEEPEEEEVPIAALRSRVAVPEVPDVEGAKLFGKIAAEREGETISEPEPQPRRSRIVGTLAWALIFIALIVAIALALLAVTDRVGDLLGGPAFSEFFGSPMTIDPAPVNTFRAEVTKLQPDAVVVVSFDYGPATEAEMDPLAEIIVRDLLDNQARVVAVSLRPEGAAMARRLLDRLKNEHPSGQRTLNLGYLPGQTAGVRSLAFLSSLPLFQGDGLVMGDYPSWQDVDGLVDVALIVDVADNPLSVRWWVEQVGPGTRANRPMVAAVSAAADPAVRPYYNRIDPKTGQLRGLVSGVTGAAAYENRLRQPGRAMEGLAAQSVAHLGLVVLSVGGTFMGFQSRSRE